MLQMKSWGRALSLACLMGISAVTAQAREDTEWTVIYSYNANDMRLPRVLLVGDSICNGYKTLVRDELAGAATITAYATSKCVTDPNYLKDLSRMLDEYPYAAIHFNNGLHSLSTDRRQWEVSLRAAIALMKEKSPSARIIWVASTPLKDPALTEKAKELNAIAARIMTEYQIPTNDLFSLMDPQDRNKLWVDTFHYNNEGNRLLAHQVAQSVRGVLNIGKTSLDKSATASAVAAGSPVNASFIANGDFESAGGWYVYPVDASAGSLNVNDEKPHGGKKSATINVIKPNYQLYQNKPGLQPGANHQLRYWACADKPGKMKVYIRTTKPPYRFIGMHTVDVTADWQQFDSLLSAPADYSAEEYKLFFEFLTPAKYVVDDVTIQTTGS